jgi:hypothetical protein
MDISYTMFKQSKRVVLRLHYLGLRFKGRDRAKGKDRDKDRARYKNTAFVPK